MNIDLDKVPLTASEALQMFIAALTDEEKKTIMDLKEDDLALFHHSLGEEIRVMWSMNEANTPLVNSFKLIGITHPEDMSGIIINSTWRQLHKKPIKLKEQVEHYQNYWLKEIGKKMP